MLLVCDAPKRAAGEAGSRADAIAGHLSDGVGNVSVMTAVDGWKTDGVQRDELDRLLAQARIAKGDCLLHRELAQ